MIKFKEKTFSEYDAMRQLYVELMKLGADRNKFKIIDTSALIPILRGNNIVIEKFTQATRIFGKDRYRMYLKIGAKAKLPDDVRLPQRFYDKELGKLELGVNVGIVPKFNSGDSSNPNPQNNQQNQQNSQSSGNPQVQYGKNGNNKGGKKGWKQKQQSAIGDSTLIGFRQKEFGDGPRPVFTASLKPGSLLKYTVTELLGDAIKYDKKERSLVLEFSSIRDAIYALNVLPFGLNYNIYLLNV